MEPGGGRRGDRLRSHGTPGGHRGARGRRVGDRGRGRSDIGGHAIISGGNVPLGGGTSAQKKHGIEDSPDLMFRDLTDWSVVEPNGFPDYRYNDREIVRAFADNSAATYEWLVAHGVIFIDKAPDALRRQVGRQFGAARDALPPSMDWPMVQTGKPADPAVRDDLLLRQRPDAAIGSCGAEGRRADPARAQDDGALSRGAEGRSCPGRRRRNQWHQSHIRARKAVIIATGGSYRQREFPPHVRPAPDRGILRPRAACHGRIRTPAARLPLWRSVRRSGASTIRPVSSASDVTKPGTIGCQYGYANIKWLPGSPIFDRARPSGLSVLNWQDAIMVNMLGQRFYDETGRAVHLQRLQFDQALHPGQLSQRRERRLQAKQLDQCRDGRNRRRPQWRRPDLGGLRH